MIKVVRFVKRRKDLTQEQFKNYWLQNHSKLEKIAMEKTPMVKIVASFATGEMAGGKEPPFDGLAELYYNNVEDLRKGFAGDVPAMMREDEKNFVDLSGEVTRVVCEDYVICEKKDGKVVMNKELYG